jgi:cytochrome c oxidase assembly protein subunit 15
MRARFRFTLATIAAAVGLLAWGAFVTSIDAGLAVPDWPSSFDSYDPFNPWPNWWEVTPILAEHGHRLPDTHPRVLDMEV